MATNTINLSGYPVSSTFCMTPEEQAERRRKEYEICKQRGHKPKNACYSNFVATYTNCEYCDVKLQYIYPTEGRWVEVEGE